MRPGGIGTNGARIGKAGFRSNGFNECIILDAQSSV